MKEEKALRDLQRGSEKALEWFIHTYTPYVTTIIYNILGNHMDMADVEEVAADVFVALWKNADTVRSPKGFLGTTARNLAKNKCREMGFVLPLEEEIVGADTLDLELAMEKKELNQAVKKAVIALPMPDREIFMRFYYYCQSLEEIANEMQINLSTVKTKLRRGKQRLRLALAQYIL